MTDPASAQKPDRPPLPRDAFRAHRVSAAAPDALAAKPVVVTPAYEDQVTTPAAHSAHADSASARKQPRPQNTRSRNPFDAYGERSSSRPYALRFPDAIDLVVRQMAAEERTQPLRIIDRIVYDHLKRIGRLPPPRET
ncbi:hypothetical protein Nham_4524 (plasmid) [Nitrobacter hamburgensis X14]|uniref:Uncharacterized protein n=1 Tax=Nitrobacter hamburgensis (strain DSM 10229 / NCIMB 13809 / X14) TaxID=323097 RepID=Q1QF93_NITHX|nr:hypothetical protein [Nitrobacter hamburgensis]ABE65104.1 hypothetical protein Nham_4524 [Nitrobacter hamburgensis X14]